MFNIVALFYYNIHLFLYSLPKLGFIPYSGICLFIYCVGIVVAWIMTSYWLLIDGIHFYLLHCTYIIYLFIEIGIAICLAITQMSVLRLPSMKVNNKYNLQTREEKVTMQSFLFILVTFR